MTVRLETSYRATLGCPAPILWPSARLCGRAVFFYLEMDITSDLVGKWRAGILAYLTGESLVKNLKC